MGLNRNKICVCCFSAINVPTVCNLHGGVLLLLLSAGVESDPGTLQVGCLNCGSTSPKTALIQDLINDHNFDILLLSETWFTTDTSQCIAPSVHVVGLLLCSVNPYQSVFINSRRLNSGYYALLPHRRQ